MAKKSNQDQRELIERELAELNERAGSKMEVYYCATSYQLYGELRERARVEKCLSYYVFGTFFQMTLSQHLLQYEMVRERAVELIAIFENEEQARKIEPELDLQEYEGLKYMMGACSYELLAESTGDLDGFNSVGMQECLNGGIEICHRIGKLECVGCFREYACIIHKAADDYELARFHCNQVLKQTSDFSDRGDRRWLAESNLALLDLMEGQHELARKRFEKAWELSDGPSVNSPEGAKAAIAFDWKTLDLIDRHPVDPRVTKALEALPPRGECPEYDLEMDCLQAIELTVNQKWDDAEKILAPWNRSLKQSKSMTKWLDTGVRIVAIRRLKGDEEGAKRIGRSLEEVATKSNDWHTVRRLSALLDLGSDVTPIGTVIRNNKVALSEAATLAQKQSSEAVPKGYHALSTDTPLYNWLNDLGLRLQKIEGDDPSEIDYSAFQDELMESPNRDWSHPEDIGRALLYMIHLVNPGANYKQIWNWANKLVANYQETGYLISLLARLGMSLNAIERYDQFTQLDFSNEETELPPPLIENERLEQLVRKSLQLDSGGVNNNFRAGEVFEYIDNTGEAERCYARAFKLDRTREDAALSLARLYSQTDRNHDAHYVLDLCIREGGESPELYFEAAMRAHSLSMHELLVSYLKTYLEKYPAEPWVQYYLAIGLLETKKPTEALQAIKAECELSGAKGLHVEAILAECYAQLEESGSAIAAIEKGLKCKASELDNLTMSGIASALERLWRAVKIAAPSGSLQVKVETRMLECGVATEEFFSEQRSQQKPRDLELFVVHLLQPLDDNWSDSFGCLPSQTHWTSYIADWGVLANSHEQATEMAIEFQSQCYYLPAEVLDVQADSETLHDRPGVAFQGERHNEDDMDMDDLDEDFDDDEDSDDDSDDLAPPFG